jgi:cellobiose phosphorylase
MFVYIGAEFAALLRYLGKTTEAKVAEAHIDEMRDTVLRHGYDGRWFLRAYDAQGRKIGSAENAEGQIFAEPQGFCVMAGIGREQGLCQTALDSVAERLAKPFGVVLQQPSFSRYYPELGEISSYPPGYKENASIFCHYNPWIMIAEALLGRGQMAFDYYRRICPAYLQDQQQVHRTEPYVYAQTIAGPDAPSSGQAKNSWLTGSAAWNYVAMTHFMLGIRPEHDGLRISPVIARETGPFRVTRHCRGAEYRISVQCVADGGVPEVFVNGARLEASHVPYAEKGAVVTVECFVHGC